MSKLNPARKLAAEIGAAARVRNAFAAELLDTRLGTSDLSREDRAFARVLCLGVASTWGTLDEVIDRCMNTPDDVRPNVRDALRVSTYEIIFLDKAGHAAVDQGVELVRAIEPKASRLANAVLRKVLASAESFPFGDPSTDDAALARSYAFPVWLAKRLMKQMGRDRAIAFMQASNEPAPVYFAVNAIKTTDDAVTRAFAQNGFAVDACTVGAGALVSGCLKAQDAHAVASHAAYTLFHSGSILVSDLAAQCIAQIAVPRTKPEAFLEVGSGRGTKTILLQSVAQRRFSSQMSLTALDSHEFKGDLLHKRADSYGVQVADTICADATDLTAALGDRDFDAAFIDAPCSGLGTLRRHPEIRWRLTSDDIDSLAMLSVRMMEEVARFVRVGGMLTYATCTVTPEENEYAVKRFLESEIGARYRIVPCAVNAESKLFCKTVLASGGCDAHFAAVLKRIS